ncbi:RdgB/HAM1 family non-canonical purine NTP pyrophosphatase [Methylomonas sp. ZR1]|uniref:RdgB/HAM1 family non-canonical purine NTP pyrophosphatase n=1 Tax=Methylomonas sp. ZR1 TaxID=1797072 RepID=UPI001492253D|nr:RdgB/HAM1 family non-canonical purine NTP pyrophosphatase [Methylomonas sp. ZR1]NOV31899.1 RdgB/HAM1 family non-canonical purine NTP pyrophosphatase [Methylomonas sp. ZR1]
MSSIVLASGNAGKIREIQAILQNDQILPQSQFKVVEPDETGATFIENAIIKARNAALHCNLPAIADDSGLAVDALGGSPGVISARYAGIGASDQANLDKLIEEMRDVPDAERSARFICVMVYLRHALDPTPIIAQGVWEGRILRQAVGENGFGYDPVFWVEQYQCSSAQLAPELKNALSHRGQALRALSQQLAGL